MKPPAHGAKALANAKVDRRHKWIARESANLYSAASAEASRGLEGMGA
jgi:hypothetical protein